MVPLLINFVDARTDTAGPGAGLVRAGAFSTYRWLRRRYGRERTMQEFLASPDVVNPVPARSAAALTVAVEPGGRSGEPGNNSRAGGRSGASNHSRARGGSGARNHGQAGGRSGASNHG